MLNKYLRVNFNLLAIFFTSTGPTNSAFKPLCDALELMIAEIVADYVERLLFKCMLLLTFFVLVLIVIIILFIKSERKNNIKLHDK